MKVRKLNMKIGDKVVVKIANENTPVFVLNGVTGTIVEEKISDSQIAMLSGISRWIVKFDEPVNVFGSQLNTCEFSEKDLESYNR
jgi:hypothetical protein